MTSSQMHIRGMLASLNISAWSARKYDKKVTKETNEAHNADADAGRYNKKLLPGDAPSYKALTQHVSQMRLEHYKMTLPWSDEGRRVLPMKEHAHYTETMRKMFIEADALLNAFVADYPALRSEARHKLNGMFNDEDYPTDIRKKYTFKIEYDPIPTGGDWRVELSQDELAILAARTEERVQSALAEAQADAVKRLHKVLAKMVERLTAVKVTKDRTTKDGKFIAGGEVKDATFRDTLVENARDIVDVLSRINLADDPELEKFRKQTEALANSVTPDELRDVPEIKEDTAKQAKEILDAMTSTYGASFFAPAPKQ